MALEVGACHRRYDLSALYTKATRRHAGQMRKDGQTPYAAHPMRVLTILAHVFGVREKLGTATHCCAGKRNNGTWELGSPCFSLDFR